ncbi:hypothetical protein CEP54_016311 [Fusarium duplospermum]|uniref:Uncharacterized protein n=1 Tax=Fusarium duplospermum TaxID=1325734 RepID=A0A428NFC2_9HYPO|nr:hypothetical protein CEP54_016311 [Fusarium duplospermum]
MTGRPKASQVPLAWQILQVDVLQHDVSYAGPPHLIHVPTIYHKSRAAEGQSQRSLPAPGRSNKDERGGPTLTRTVDEWQDLYKPVQYSNGQVPRAKLKGRHMRQSRRRFLAF